MRNLGHAAVVSFALALLCSSPARGADPLAPPANLDARIEQLIQQLGHENYVLREQAQDELQQIGPPALDALAQAQNSDDIEIEIRARYLMTAIKIEWTLDTDPERVRKLMEDYAELSEEGRRERIHRLAEMGNLTAVEVLCRIVRFDSSPLVSKLAALALMDMQRDEDQWVNHTRAIARNLAGTRVVAAEWLRVFITSRKDPAGAIEPWQRLVDAERAVWKSAPGKTNWQVVQALLLRLIDQLEQLGREADTEEYMRQIVELQPKDEQSIKKLVRWLEDRQAFRLVVLVAEKYPEIFQGDPLLLYGLAHAQQKLGQREAVQKSVERAQQLNPSSPQNHLVIAFQLQGRGWFEWAEQEYRRVIEITGMRHELAIRATFLLSEMLHDQQQDKKAGEVLQALVEQTDRDEQVRRLIEHFERDVGSIRSRMHFFFANHYARQGETAKQQQELDRALGADPTDADVLIAHYRLPNASAERRAGTERAIRRAMEVFRNRIEQEPDEASPHNQFAWLVGNTLGEKDPALADQAIRYSQRSLEIRPDAAGYLDTLGRCYFARGDFPQAVKHQRRAAELEPHSGLIRRQLELFEQKLGEAEGDR